MQNLTEQQYKRIFDQSDEEHLYGLYLMKNKFINEKGEILNLSFDYDSIIVNNETYKRAD